jgi:hypothetical protein
VLAALNQKLQPKRRRAFERMWRREPAGERMIEGAVRLRACPLADCR